MKTEICKLLNESISVKQKILNDVGFIDRLAQVAALLKETFKQGGTLYCAGNGGSTCDAMHFVEELVARYKRDRPGFKAMHLMDAATLTCWSNDYDFDDAFARVVRTFCSTKDVLALFSTSGNSANVIQAAEAAKKLGTKVVGFTGRDGGKLKALSDIALVVPASESERIQEVHITCVHILCELLEQ